MPSRTRASAAEHLCRSGADQSNQTIRVLVIDDHEMVALGLQSLIEDEPDIEVVAMAHSIAAGLAAARERQPDVVLVDYRLPDGNGAEAARELRRFEQAPRVVMITSVPDRRVLAQALDAGCSGFVSKSAGRSDLIAAIRAAARNDSYFTRDVLKHLVHLRRSEQFDGAELSDREVEILQLIADGLTTEQTADLLFLSVHTIKNHLRHAMAKLDAHTKLEAVVKAVRAQVISIG